jgi:hypothetical protein
MLGRTSIARRFIDGRSIDERRIQALPFKAVRRLYPDYSLWRDFVYKYEQGKLAIDCKEL